MKAELEVAWANCHDGKCRACAKCNDAAESRAAALEAEVVALKALLKDARPKGEDLVWSDAQRCEQVIDGRRCFNSRGHLEGYGQIPCDTALTIRERIDAALAPAKLAEGHTPAKDAGGGALPAQGETVVTFSSEERFFTACAACGKPLLIANLLIDDGCPCNSARGVNVAPQPCARCGTSDCVKPGHRMQEVAGAGLPLFRQAMEWAADFLVGSDWTGEPMTNAEIIDMLRGLGRTEWVMPPIRMWRNGVPPAPSPETAMREALEGVLRGLIDRNANPSLDHEGQPVCEIYSMCRMCAYDGDPDAADLLAHPHDPEAACGKAAALFCPPAQRPAAACANCGGRGGGITEEDTGWTYTACNGTGRAALSSPAAQPETALGVCDVRRPEIGCTHALSSSAPGGEK